MFSSLTDHLKQPIERILAASGDSTPITGSTRVGGGDINHAARITTSQQAYFLKWHDHPPTRFFTCEADGLNRLQAAGVVRVPEVVGVGSVDGSRTQFLVLEWIEQNVRKDTRAAELLGRQLAQLHSVTLPSYGLETDNYIGRLPQPNQQSTSWVAFYGEQRLAAQRDLAAQNGLMPPVRRKRLDTLINRLDQWIDDTVCRPSLLHGDLWGGNWMADSSGRPVLIDPAVYAGDREADLAMTVLFGGFPESFYRAYAEVLPLPPGYSERQPLYKLYYLLCHLNLFGETYGSSVDAILGHFS